MPESLAARPQLNAKTEGTANWFSFRHVRFSPLVGLRLVSSAFVTVGVDEEHREHQKEPEHDSVDCPKRHLQFAQEKNDGSDKETRDGQPSREGQREYWAFALRPPARREWLGCADQRRTTQIRAGKSGEQSEQSPTPGAGICEPHDRYGQHDRSHYSHG